MPAPVVAEVLRTSDDRTTTEILTTDAATAVGDTLIIAYASDFFTFAGMGNATSSAGTLTSIRTVDAGTNLGHVKTYSVEVTSGGAKTITFPNHLDADIFGVVLRIPAVTVDVHDGQVTATGTTSHVAQSVTTTGVDRLLIDVWFAYDVNTGFTTPYTTPGSMTFQAMPKASPFAVMLVATEEIAAAGATGTRTATFFQAEAYISVSIAVAGASAAATAPPTVRRPRLGALMQL